MSVEQNKATIRRFNDQVINKGHYELVEEVYSPNLTHSRRGLEWIARAAKGHKAVNSASNPLSAHEGFIKGLENIKQAFPDYHSEIEEMTGEGNVLIIRYTVSGTHRGELMGIPPTGKPCAWTQIVKMTFDDKGRVADIWAISDELGLLLQMGLAKLPQESQPSQV